MVLNQGGLFGVHGSRMSAIEQTSFTIYETLYTHYVDLKNFIMYYLAQRIEVL